jgi:hypothetical protein
MDRSTKGTNMQIFILLLTTWLSTKAIAYDFNHQGLRENQPMIIEITNLEVKQCPECNNPTTTVSYDLEAKDAFLRMDSISTVQGNSYYPYLESYKTKVQEPYNSDEKPLIPLEGKYIGILWKICGPMAMGADGTCRKWQIKFHLSSEVIQFKN